MIDLEERLRAELNGLRTRDLDLGVATDDVIASARRVRGRRQLRGAISLVAAAAAIGVVAMPLAGMLRGTDQPVPATPAGPSTSTESGLGRVEFDLAQYELGDDFASLGVAVRRVGDRVEATATRYSASGMMQAQFGPAISPSVEEALWFSVGPRVEFGVISGVATWVAPRGLSAERMMVTKDLPELDATVYLTIAPKGEANQTTIMPNVLWQDRNGAVRSGAAGQLPSTAIDVAGNRGTAYLDLGADEFGFVASTGDSWRFKASEAAKRTRCYFSGEELDGKWDVAVFCLLPPGAQNPEPELVDATKHALADVGGRKLLVMPGSADSIKGIVTSVSYTNTDGQTVTDPV